MMIIYGTTKPRLIKDAQLIVEPPIENPKIGEPSSFGVKITNNTSYHNEFVLFELINERTDKRAPLDKVTSRSRYLFRHNINKNLQDGENDYSLDIRIPMHKEASRNDKFIRIRWQLNSQVYLKKNVDDKEFFCAEADSIDVEVV